MNFFPLWPIPSAFALAVAIALLPYASALDEKQDAGARAVSIDGLRGFLAIGVFIHHYSMMGIYKNTGIWAPPPSQSYARLGQLSVALFFMITGFLFWGKLVRSEGSPGWVKLYIGRLFRIGPMYLAVVSAMAVVAFSKTNWKIAVPVSSVIKSLITWLCFGIPSDHPDINGLANTRLILSGVTWTLHFEWFFYFALFPISPLAARGRHLAFSIAGFALSTVMSAMAPRASFTYGSLFFAGMLIAALHNRFSLQGLRNNIYSVFSLICLLSTFALPEGQATHAITVVLLTAFFSVVAAGNTFWGILTSRPALRLGNISYSIYLVQGLAITAAFWDKNIVRHLLSSPNSYWFFSLSTLAILLAISSVGYLWIEKPGIACGKWLYSKIIVRGIGRGIRKQRGVTS